MTCRLPGHVTLTNVVWVKGNEADLVHIVGLDEVGLREEQVSMPNQLFVALSRSRGWVSLSGRQTPAVFREEVRAVLAAGEEVTYLHHESAPAQPQRPGRGHASGLRPAQPVSTCW
ncbi:hypothetical protein DKM44_14575 [Deinococcus irradiatisoli]|uniref:UvrD-like helicase C-terminal domain-containing protein n=1 Tax=Deinococcus irradiatisoli TaxID=2202254 RepID=A0A2Z3JL79_9DEIO|nr:hypothetical protein [Deinococcus irradiatisoli]AWN24301.1 hypothetical protein DKM44_14575 [Deinococcus irradiatisoli]